MAKWIKKGLDLREKLGMKSALVDDGGGWVLDERGVYWSYNPRIYGGIMGLEWGKDLWGEKGDNPELTVMLKFLGDSGTVFDVGANIGYFSILLAKEKPNIKVHAFEPIMESFYRLQMNIMKNQLTESVYPNRLAIGDHSGTVEMTCLDSTGNRLIHPGERVSPKNREKVPLTTLDLYSKQKGIRDVVLIKCDVGVQS